jgi:hypothetical protein
MTDEDVRCDYTAIQTDSLFNDCRELIFALGIGGYTNANVAVDQLRNETINLGGNTIFVLDDRVFTLSGVPESGAAYRCP